MMDKHKITRFYLEMLIMVAVFAGVILLLADVFAVAKEKTNEAKLLTSAVQLAENSAELAAGAEDGMELFRQLNEDGSTAWIQEGSSLRTRYDAHMVPDRDGPLWLEISWNEDGNLVRYQIQVLWQEKQLYQMKTAVYKGGSGT